MFPDQKPYENVLLVLRRHWLVLFSHFLRLLILLVVGLGVYLYMLQYQANMPSGLAIFLLVAYTAAIWEIFFLGLVDYLLDTWIITDHRIVDISQCGFFKRNVSELRYPKIEDVTVEIKGFIPTMFDFGNVMIQTAAEVSEFKFKQVPHPNQVKDEIFKTHDQFASQHPGGEEVHENNIPSN